MKVARLNENAIGLFAGWMETLKQGGSLRAPLSLLTDAQFTEPLGVEIEVEARTFANRFEAADNESDGADVVPSIRWESRGSMPAAKLNAWALSGDGATLDLFVSLYHGTDGLPEVGLPDTRRQFKLAGGFLRRASEGFHGIIDEANPAYQAARQIHEAKDSLTTVRLFFLTDGIVRSLELEEEPFGELEVRYVFWDLDKLSRLHVGHREVIELDFVNDFGGAIPCLATIDATKEYRTFLAFMPGTMLARIYGEHGQRLLERNVRAFLQAKGKANKGLQQKLREEPNRFLAYNNGLCCTAAEVHLEKSKKGQLVLSSVKDFQIVNGGQTTASIYHALKKERMDVSGVVVQVKLTVLKDQAKVVEMVPLVDQSYFHQVVAQAILWRTAEKLFDTLDLEGYRANSVAYAVAWLAEKTARGINLNRIWNEQRLTPALCETVKAVCNVAWQHLNQQQGNVGGVSKKAECWESFRTKEIALGQEWRSELAEHPFVAPRSEEEALAAEWERLRDGFIADTRTIEGLEAYTSREWVRNRRRDPVSLYAVLTWEQLRLRPGLGLKKIRALVEMFAIAAQG